MAGSFEAQVSAWVAATKQRTVAVRNESAQRIIEIAQRPMAAGGRMRVDTSFLRASLLATTSNALPGPTFKPDGDVRFSYDAGQVALTIAGADLDDVITAVWTANYARPRNYGSRGQPGDHFRDLAAQQWTNVVAQVAAEAQSRAGA